MEKTLISINYDKIRETSKEVNNIIRNIKIDPFTDPQYYPPITASKEDVLRYFIFMVAIDHRTSRPNTPYEAIINGKLYHGADLLYRLGMLKWNEDPDFFSPSRMAKITVDEVKSWLTAKLYDRKVCVPDIEIRAMLLRDLGLKLLRLYDGSVEKMIQLTNNRVKYRNEGLVNRLKVFTAYEDPVEKKAYLFIKFITRRKLFSPIDKENLEVPVDNHLTRIAIRLGYVNIQGKLYEKIVNGIETTWEEDVLIRMSVRMAFKYLSKIINIDPTILDDFLWMFGRTCCLRDGPRCHNPSEKCIKYGWCDEKGCKLRHVCPTANNEPPILNEHTYYNTWYY